MSDDQDIRVTVKVRNARILRRMEEAGIDSVRQLAQRADISLIRLYALINMKISGRMEKRSDGEWRSAVLKLSEFFRCLPEDLIGEVQEYQGLKRNTASKDVSFEDIRLLLPTTTMRSPEDRLLMNEGNQLLSELISTLRPREQYVLTRRFGLGDTQPRSAATIADDMGLSVARVNQIELKALDRLHEKTKKNKQLRRQLEDHLSAVSSDEQE